MGKQIRHEQKREICLDAKRRRWGGRPVWASERGGLNHRSSERSDAAAESERVRDAKRAANKLSISNGLAVSGASGSTCIMWPGGGVLCKSFHYSECRAAKAQSESGNRAVRKVS